MASYWQSRAFRRLTVLTVQSPLQTLDGMGTTVHRKSLPRADLKEESSLQRRSGAFENLDDLAMFQKVALLFSIVTFLFTVGRAAIPSALEVSLTQLTVELAALKDRQARPQSVVLTDKARPQNTGFVIVYQVLTKSGDADMVSGLPEFGAYKSPPAMEFLSELTVSQFDATTPKHIEIFSR
jgi:hypothetical protein